MSDLVEHAKQFATQAHQRIDHRRKYNNHSLLDALGFGSKKVAKQVGKELESLRNYLAPAQDIISNDWVQVARLALRIEELSQTQADSHTQI